LSTPTVPALEDGTVVVSTDSPRTFLIEGGRRRSIPDEATLVTHRLVAAPRVPLPDTEIDPLPPGPALPPAPKATAQVKTFLGGGHYMDTGATLLGSGELTAVTRTYNITWLSGFTGGVIVTLQDESGVVIAASPLQRYGVDGTALGRSDRTESWSASFSPELVARTRSIAIVHAWVPKVDLLGTVLIVIEVGKFLWELFQILIGKGSAGGGEGPKLPGPLLPSPI
jgi:hypothetical protein